MQGANPCPPCYELINLNTMKPKISNTIHINIMNLLQEIENLYSGHPCSGSLATIDPEEVRDLFKTIDIKCPNCKYAFSLDDEQDYNILCCSCGSQIDTGEMCASCLHMDSQSIY